MAEMPTGARASPLPLLLLLLLSALSLRVADAAINRLPEPYRREFERGDRFSTIVRFVKDVQRNNSLVCNEGFTRYSLASFRSDSPEDRAQPNYTGFEASQRSILSLANLFNYIFQLAEKKPFEEWFNQDANEAFWYSVVSSVVASDKRIFGCYVVLFNNRSHPIRTVPHAHRRSDQRVEIDNYIQEVYLKEDQAGLEWFKHHTTNYNSLVQQILSRPSQNMTPNSDKMLKQFTTGLLTSFGAIKVVTEKEGFWSPPVFLCSPWNRWLVSYAVPFMGRFSDDSKRMWLGIKGWLVLEFDLNNLEINQCANDSTFRTFYSNNVCNQATTECSNIPGRGFTDTNFECKCRKYFHHGNFTGETVRQQYLLHISNNASNYSSLECSPCPINCPASCTTDGQCHIEYDLDTLRALPLVIQTFCMTVCLLVAGIVFKTRKNRIIKASVWILLEIFLAGILLLYSTVFLMYMQASYEICFIIPWLREIGFAVTYGTLLVKIYRVLCSFQSRKAHRVHVRDRDLMKYLTAIVTVAVGFMSAWTAATVDHGRRLAQNLQDLDCGQDLMSHRLILEDGQVANKRLVFRVCAVGYWEAVCAVAELSFLTLGLFYCYCVRSAPTDCFETRCITAAFSVELVVSLGYHVARHFVYNTMHPDYLYLMYFARCHLTVTVTAVLVIGPRLWFVHNPPKNSMNSRSLMYSQVGGHLGEAMSPIAMTSNGDVDALEVNITDMNPEDIRAELKRLYTQLEIFKTKVMRKENPHISKRKGGRKQTHRRFSLQPFYNKHSHSKQQASAAAAAAAAAATSVQEEEASKVSDDSSNSIDGGDTDRSSGRESIGCGGAGGGGGAVGGASPSSSSAAAVPGLPLRQ
ncbi:hypothetical protein BOX15_Mlig011472g1 [Macrostomum lignano]|uniref:G-protein coupled receptors family 3 profile domain-containing protein n=1 Tax=Macrostomum lignano TaxID=282301 RepID=A0A267EJJ8_9PLAT|nr:hypothetical protein BOX15_Mlig011472g1 [Macrostomum lignano]